MLVYITHFPRCFVHAKLEGVLVMAHLCFDKVITPDKGQQFVVQSTRKGTYLVNALLQVLNLRSCRNLVALPEGLFIGMGQLRKLNMDSCGRLASLPGSLTCLAKLERLDLGLCMGLEALPPGMLALTSLKVLDMAYNTVNIPYFGDGVQVLSKAFYLCSTYILCLFAYQNVLKIKTKILKGLLWSEMFIAVIGGLARWK